MRRLLFILLASCCPRPKVVTVHDLVLQDVPKPCVRGPLPEPTADELARPCWQDRPMQHVLDAVLGYPEAVCLSPRLAQQLANDLSSWKQFGDKVATLCFDLPSP